MALLDNYQRTLVIIKKMSSALVVTLVLMVLLSTCYHVIHGQEGESNELFPYIFCLTLVLFGQEIEKVASERAFCRREVLLCS